MARTQGDRLDELTKRVDSLALAIEGLRTASTVEIAHVRELLKDVQSVVKEVQTGQTKLTERTAALEQRCAALEKQADRGWQLWLALIGAGLALIVAIFKK